MTKVTDGEGRQPLGDSLHHSSPKLVSLWAHEHVVFQFLDLEEVQEMARREVKETGLWAYETKRLLPASFCNKRHFQKKEGCRLPSSKSSFTDVQLKTVQREDIYCANRNVHVQL